MIECSRMDRILEVHAEDRYAVVQPGVVNAELSRAVAGHGLFYAPDPSSQAACTIGGNVAENSGGPHTLKYGTTTNHVLGPRARAAGRRGRACSAGRRASRRISTSSAPSSGARARSAS